MKFIIIGTLSYLVGCFSSAYFLGRAFKKIDIRVHGSGNTGATNAMRVMGTKIGVLTFLLDFVKGIVGVLIGYGIAGFNGGLVGGMFSVIGHDFPVFLGFKGGKGVATTLGAVAVLNFPAALISISIWLIVMVVTRYVSLGSVIFLAITPLFTSIVGKGFNPSLFITTIGLALLGIYRHKENIKRLIKGTENKTGRWDKWKTK